MTYQQIKDAILVLLDVNTASTGDIASQVVVHMKRIMDELAVDVRPRQLLIGSSLATITSATTAIGLTTGTVNFGVTNFMSPFCLRVDENATDTEEELTWDYLSYESWLRMRGASGGESRGDRTWTIDGADNILLRPWPTTAGESWRAKLYYYKQPAAIVLSASPELPVGHHFAIVLGATIAFPNMFQGEERIALLATYRGDYELAKRRLLTHRDADMRETIWGISGGNPTNRSTRDLTWGPFQTS